MKKVFSGQPLDIPAPTYNDMVEAAKADRARKLSASGGRSEYMPPDTDVILVQNDSGADRERFDILGIDDVVITPTENAEEFKSRVALSGIEPVPNTHLGRFVVLLEPIADGKLGRACISGVCPCQIDVIDAGHKYADINPDSGDRFRAASRQFGGAEILWKESGTGTKWAVLRLGSTTLFRRFELKTALAIGGTATAHPLDWSGVADTTAANEFTVYDTLSKHRGWARVAGTRNGARGLALFHHDRESWDILDLQHVARSINFTLTEDMGYTTAGQASVTVDDYYDGVAPSVPYSSIKVYDPQGLHANTRSGAKGKARLDDRSDEYHIVEIERASGYAKVQGTHTNQSGATSLTVSIKKCDWDGSNVTGSAFNAKTQLRANRDTAVFDGYVVRYDVQPDGTYLITSDIWDDPIGTRRLVGAAAAIRDGWEEDTDTRDMFIIGMGEGVNYGDTGGLDAHDHDPHDDPGMGSCIQVATSTTSGVYALAYSGTVHSEESNSPEWIAYRWIKRTT